MVTPDEQRGLQLENAEAEERFWTSLQDMNQSTVEEHKALAATVEHAIASGQAGAANAAAKTAIAKERVARIRKGEDVPGGLGKRFTSEDAIKILRANRLQPERHPPNETFEPLAKLSGRSSRAAC